MLPCVDDRVSEDGGDCFGGEDVAFQGVVSKEFTVVVVRGNVECWMCFIPNVFFILCECSKVYHLLIKRLHSDLIHKTFY